MTAFETQMAARLQAQEFLLCALIRPHLAQMEPQDAAALAQELRRQFSSIRIPEDAEPGFDPDQVLDMHRLAQSFLARILDAANPHRPE